MCCNRRTLLKVLVLRSCVVDDDESRTGRLLPRLRHASLRSWLGEDLRRVKVVDSCLQEAGLQS